MSSEGYGGWCLQDKDGKLYSARCEATPEDAWEKLVSTKLYSETPRATIMTLLKLQQEGWRAVHVTVTVDTEQTK